MLEKLVIQNIILVEEATIAFTPGFNVLTGETGAGKSAILAALKLALGGQQRKDLLRSGCKTGVVEAHFSDTILRREILDSGRSRAFIDDRLVSLKELKKRASSLVEMVGQASGEALREEGVQRNLLDQFGEIGGQTAKFAHKWATYTAGETRLERLLREQEQRTEERKQLLHDLEELEQIDCSPEAEEERTQEHALLQSAEERRERALQATETLRALSLPNLSPLAALDPACEELSSRSAALRIEIDDLTETLERYAYDVDRAPLRLQQLEEQMTLLHQLKRRYGDPTSSKQRIAERLTELEKEEEELHDLQDSLQELQEALDQLAAEITKQRTSTGLLLGKAMKAELQGLNMPDIEVEVQLRKGSRSKSGDDQVSFFFSPNPGEPSLPLRECASGGELARWVLSLHALLARHSLIFDEVDAHIGGKTASFVGEKLAKIGKQNQVICITHFPQVAKHADTHFKIEKEHNGERTLTKVTPLCKDSRSQELLRMQG